MHLLSASRRTPLTLPRPFAPRRALLALLATVAAVLAAVGAAPAADAAPTVVGWGRAQDFGVTTGASLVPPTPIPGVAGATAAAVGPGRSFVLTPDGVLGVGGDVGFADGQVRTTLTLIPGTAGARAVSVGGAVLVLRADGTVAGFGSNAYGDAGGSPGTARLTPTPVAGLDDVTAIASGIDSSLALRADGSVWAWGNFGTLGSTAAYAGGPTGTPQRVALPIGRRATAIAAGYNHDLALLDDGSVVAWGRNSAGQIGNGSAGSTDVQQPVVVYAPAPGAPSVRSIAAGIYFSVALLSDGSFRSWGTNGSGQLGLGNGAVRVTVPTAPAPTLPASHYPAFTGISIVGSTVFAIAGPDASGTSGRVWGWGSNTRGQLGFGDGTPVYDYPFPYPDGPEDPDDASDATEIPQRIGRLKQVSWLGVGGASVGGGQQIAVTEPTLRPRSDTDAQGVFFYSQPVGTVSARLAAPFRSFGDPSTITRVRIVGPNARDFEIAGHDDSVNGDDGPLPVTIGSDDQFTVDVRFLPSALGPRNATVVLEADGETASIPLSGIGTELPGNVPGPKGDAVAGPPGKDGAPGRNGTDGVVTFVSTRALTTIRRGRSATLPFVLANGTGSSLAPIRLTAEIPPALRGRRTVSAAVASLPTGGSRTLRVRVAAGRAAKLGTHRVSVRLKLGTRTVTRTVRVRVTR